MAAARGKQQKARRAADFEKKLAQYALMGGAMLGASTAHASIITTTYDETVLDNGTPIQVSMDNSATVDFTLSATSGNPELFVYFVGATVSGPSTTQFAASPTHTTRAWPYALGGNTTIPGTMNFAGASSASSAKLSQYFKVGPDRGNAGYWPNNTPEFLGLSFQRSGLTYYGWAEISVDVTTQNATATLYEVAYNNVAGQPITTPALASIPEPSSLALFALGAIGIAALKKRRKAA